jgi:hypothetical protein
VGPVAAFVAALSICCSLPLAAAQAGSTTTPFGVIKQIGCDASVDTICFIYLASSAGPAGCNTVSLRFDPNEMANGSTVLSMLTQAALAGNYVSFNISDTCFREDPRFATFDYFFIQTF